MRRAPLLLTLIGFALAAGVGGVVVFVHGMRALSRKRDGGGFMTAQRESDP